MPVNDLTASLKPYPMEQLNQIRQKLASEQREVFDFGTGDPKIPVWPPIQEALIQSLSPISQYPSIRATTDLQMSQDNYVKRTIKPLDDHWITLPTRGSKEAIFHLALSVIGRNGKNTLAFPDPGYPVYRSSCLFAGGIPVAVPMHPKKAFAPWDVPDLQQGAAALWVNSPHNPTGSVLSKNNWIDIIQWCKDTKTLLLSDDCYTEIYQDTPPIHPLELTTRNIISVVSLSKRSGLTGYRAGMLVGDPDLLQPHTRARANFGLGQPQFIQAASCAAWDDDKHVAERRQIFRTRMKTASAPFIKHGFLDSEPEATFYLWLKIPQGCDVAFCKKLATDSAIIASPSSWFSAKTTGWIRLALVPDQNDIQRALPQLLRAFEENKIGYSSSS
ncbi:MAG: pyridoxal phosphate-dependent aminotransferase [Oligoflexales bacterium]